MEPVNDRKSDTAPANSYSPLQENMDLQQEKAWQNLEQELDRLEKAPKNTYFIKTFPSNWLKKLLRKIVKI